MFSCNLDSWRISKNQSQMLLDVVLGALYNLFKETQVRQNVVLQQSPLVYFLLFFCLFIQTRNHQKYQLILLSLWRHELFLQKSLYEINIDHGNPWTENNLKNTHKSKDRCWCSTCNLPTEVYVLNQNKTKLSEKFLP